MPPWDQKGFLLSSAHRRVRVGHADLTGGGCSAGARAGGRADGASDDVNAASARFTASSSARLASQRCVATRFRTRPKQGSGCPRLGNKRRCRDDSPGRAGGWLRLAQPNCGLPSQSRGASSRRLLLRAWHRPGGDTQKREADNYGTTHPGDQQDYHNSFNCLRLTVVLYRISTIGADHDHSTVRSPEFSPGDFPGARAGDRAELSFARPTYPRRA
jgi:hypothetical protein